MAATDLLELTPTVTHTNIHTHKQTYIHTNKHTDPQREEHAISGCATALSYYRWW